MTRRCGSRKRNAGRVACESASLTMLLMTSCVRRHRGMSLREVMGSNLTIPTSARGEQDRRCQAPPVANALLGHPSWASGMPCNAGELSPGIRWVVINGRLHGWLHSFPCSQKMKLVTKALVSSRTMEPFKRLRLMVQSVTRRGGVRYRMGPLFGAMDPSVRIRVTLIHLLRQGAYRSRKNERRRF